MKKSCQKFATSPFALSASNGKDDHKMMISVLYKLLYIDRYGEQVDENLKFMMTGVQADQFTDF